MRRAFILPRLQRKTLGLLVVLGVVVLLLAWIDGGEREIGPIEEEIAVPEGAL
ncbi:hypothetical protein [Qipengyuania sediminis]|uniref:hypothetical protein n=1 Tax=Qipengyuania sediminis TaxID=1532023 RepID=UPI001404BB26|nr:hypothetical protein [Qipengyuania sediminis]